MKEKQIVHRSLAELKPDYRNILWLIYSDDFTNREAAKILRKSNRQIKNLLYRAKQSLRTKLKKEGFSYEEL